LREELSEDELKQRWQIFEARNGPIANRKNVVELPAIRDDAPK
jgi:hypothetical protein